ncbi:hypothetical protein ELD87_05320, partial [Klebsiella pneumoniae]|nr:hypothetical protein [Klebsiella pneumoniae]
MGGGDCGRCRRRRRGRTGATAAGAGEGVAGARVLAAPNPLTVALLAIFYSPSLNEGETETLQNIR